MTAIPLTHAFVAGATALILVKHISRQTSRGYNNNFKLNKNMYT